MLRFICFMLLVAAGFVVPVVGVGAGLEALRPGWLAPTWIVLAFVGGVGPYIWFVFIPLVEWAERRWWPWRDAR